MRRLPSIDRQTCLRWAVLLLSLAVFSPLDAQTVVRDTTALLAGVPGHALGGAALVSALRRGGYVLVMRHASSPRTLPGKNAADPDNTQLERQLDDQGRSQAQAMGEALRKLRIPIGDVWSSPTYRARLTAKLAGFVNAKAVPELGEAGQGMQADTDARRAAWLRSKAAEPPRAGANTVIITHVPNILGAFGQTYAGLGDGDTLVFRPDGKGGAAFVAHVKCADWPQLAAQ
jgi:phosphohistidine phosphatase SixA